MIIHMLSIYMKRIHACSCLPAILCLSLFQGSALPKTERPAKSQNAFVCGTSAARSRDAHARARYGISRDALRAGQDGKRRLLATEPVALISDIGDVAVMEDDGTLITEPNAFDLRLRAFRFEPVDGESYRVIASDASFDPSGGTSLALTDDDASLQSLGFPFTFFGEVYDSVYVNSDGNLTFGESDTAHTARDLGRFSYGPPRIGPYFADLDPERGKVSVLRGEGTILFVWDAVPRYESGGTTEFNSFSVRLWSNGNIDFTFGEKLLAAESVVGISPGSGRGGISALNYADDLPTQSLGGTIAEVFSDTFVVSESFLARRFLATHPDDFDHLNIFLDFDYDLGGGAYAYELNIKNEISGIGLPLDDESAAYGSKGRLRSLLNMGTLTGFGRYPSDPNQVFLGTNSTMGIMGQESGHRWLAFTPFQDGAATSLAILGRDDAHWSFFLDSDGSVMEGNDIEDRGAALGSQRFKTIAATNTYSLLDQYIMGLIGPDQVGGMFLVENPIGTAFRAWSNPLVGATFGGTRKEIGIESIVAANGPREPASYAAPKVFRQAFILLARKGQPPAQSQVEKVQRIRDAWVQFFNEQTGGQGWIVTDLQRTPGTTPAAMVFPYFQGNRNRTTGIAMANWGATATDVLFTAYDNAGKALSAPDGILNPRMLTIPPASQVALFAEQIHGLSLEDPRNGWIRAESTSSQITGFFLDGDVEQTLMDGAVGAGPTTPSIYFTRIAGGLNQRTLINIVNPGEKQTTVTLTLYGQEGKAVAVSQRILSGRGRLAEELTSLFPEMSAAGQGGFVTAVSEVGVIGYEYVELASAIYSLPAQTAGKSERIYSAQFASGKAGSLRYFTDLNLLNTSSESRTAEVLLVGSDGAPILAPVNPARLTIPAGGQRQARGESLFGLPDALLAEGLVEGSLVIRANGPGIAGDVLFGDPVAGRFMASLPLEANPASDIMLSHVAQGFAGGTKPYFTGLAIYNPNADGALVTIDVFSETGVKTGSATISLPSGNRIAKTLPELVPSITEQARGYIRLSTGGIPIVAFELFGDQTVDFLAAVPPQPILP